jgi:homospermidine synthase
VLSCHELIGNNYVPQKEKRILKASEITSGEDALGVLLMGIEKNAYWFGSKLNIDQAKSLIPFNTATSLQVTITVIAGMIWALENPNRGIVEPEEMDHERILEIAEPYLGDMVGVYTDWNPTKDDRHLFKERLSEDVWQFENFLIQ